MLGIAGTRLIVLLLMNRKSISNEPGNYPFSCLNDQVCYGTTRRSKQEHWGTYRRSLLQDQEMSNSITIGNRMGTSKIKA